MELIMKNNLYHFWIVIVAIPYYTLLGMILSDKHDLALNQAHLKASSVFAHCFSEENNRIIEKEDIEALTLYQDHRSTITKADDVQKKATIHYFLKMIGDESLTERHLLYQLDHATATFLINMLSCADFFDAPFMFKTTKNLIAQKIKKGFDDPQVLELLPPNIAHIFLNKSSCIVPALSYFLHKTEHIESSFRLKNNILSVDIFNHYLACSQENAIKLYRYNKKSLSLLRIISDMPNANLSFSKTGTYLAITSPTEIIVYKFSDLVTKIKAQPLVEKTMLYCSSIAFNHDDTLVSFAHSPKAISIINLRTQESYIQHTEKIIGNLWWHKQRDPEYKPAGLINEFNDFMTFLLDGLLSNYETPINEMIYSFVHHQSIPLTAEQKKFAHVPLYISADKKKALTFSGKNIRIYNSAQIRKKLSLGQVALIKNVYNYAKKEEKFDFADPKNRAYKTIYQSINKEIKKMLTPFITDHSNSD